MNIVSATVDLQIQGLRAGLRDLLYLWLYSCYQRDLGVYFYIIEVKDHNDDMINTATVTVDLQIRWSRAYFAWPSISLAALVLSEKIAVSIPTLSRSRITIVI